MPPGNPVIRRDRTGPTGGTAPANPRPPARAAASPPGVVLIESDPNIRSALGQLLGEWGLRVIEANPDSGVPVSEDHTAAAAIITDFELGADPDRSPPFNGLDIALLIARRAARAIPILVTSDNFGRHAIPACSPHRIPVIFKPFPSEFLRGWLVHTSLLTDSPPWPRVNGYARSAA